MRSGVCLVLVLAAATVAAASARADGTSTSTTTAATTTATTTAASYAPLAAASLPTGCLGAGGVLVEEPGHAPVALDTPATALAASGYPSDASVVSFASAGGSGAACRSGNVSLHSLSLFGGVITATSVVASGGRGSVSGLEQDGAPLALSPGETTFVDGWARITLDGRIGRLSAPLILTLDQPHGSLPAGTVVLVGFGQAPAVVAKHVSTTAAKAASKAPSKSAPASSAPAHHTRRKHVRHKKHVPQPLKVTPQLGPIHYVFPVDGGASYVDTYGANRSDIYDGWHHGDDLFAPLGTPVVAVARGTLSLVGWNPLGGWRLWLTDRDGNSFYYAHLSGYSRWILHHRHVRAGQVIGFLGRTGDAYTTTPHLHFEVHPHQLLKLGYDGAVDPTTYLHAWRVVRVPTDEIPRPARLRAPAGTPREEAAVVWHELLVARHLLPQTPGLRFGLRRPLPGELGPGAGVRLHVAAAERVAERVAPVPSPGPWPTAVTAAVLAVGGFALFAFGRRRRWARGG